MKTVILQLLVLSAFSTAAEEHRNISGCSLWYYRPSRNNTECICGRDWNRLIFCRNGQLFLRDNFLLGTMNTSDPDVPSAPIIGESWFVFLDSGVVSEEFRSYYQLPNTSNETELNDRLCHPNNCAKIVSLIMVPMPTSPHAQNVICLCLSL